jgi:allene oxide cyclase
MPRLFPLLAAAAAAAMLAAGAGASAQSPATRTLTFKEGENGATFVHVRNTRTKMRRANLQGDLLVFTNPLLDGSGAKVGKVAASCVTTTGARNFEKSVMTCTGVMTLRDGTLTLQANISPSAPVTGAVTGGTGAYAYARGVLTSVDGVDTITLAS